MRANKNQLLENLRRLRILQTSFTTFAGERKTHYLLTYTPEDIPIADENYQLSRSELVELIEGLDNYLSNSKPLKKTKRGDGSPRAGQEAK